MPPVRGSLHTFSTSCSPPPSGSTTCPPLPRAFPCPPSSGLEIFYIGEQRSVGVNTEATLLNMAVFGGHAPPLSHLATLFETASAICIYRVIGAFCDLVRCLDALPPEPSAMPVCQSILLVPEENEQGILALEADVQAAPAILLSKFEGFKQCVAEFAAARIQSVWRSLAPHFRLGRDCCCEDARPDSALCVDCRCCLACGACMCDVGNHVAPGDIVDAETAAASVDPAALSGHDAVAKARAYVPFFRSRFPWHWAHSARVRHLKTFLIEHLQLDFTWDLLRSESFVPLWSELSLAPSG